MKAWKVWYEVASGDVIHDIYTRWLDVEYLKRIGSVIEIQEVTL